MKILPRLTPFVNRSIRVPNSAQNSSHKYLYNEVVDIVKHHKVPALIKNEGIDIIDVPAKLLQELYTSGIKFEPIDVNYIHISTR